MTDGKTEQNETIRQVHSTKYSDGKDNSKARPRNKIPEAMSNHFYVIAKKIAVTYLSSHQEVNLIKEDDGFPTTVMKQLE